jgi:hypothetical protein
MMLNTDSYLKIYTGRIDRINSADLQNKNKKLLVQKTKKNKLRGP